MRPSASTTHRYHTTAADLGTLLDAASESMDKRIDDFEVDDADELDEPEFD